MTITASTLIDHFPTREESRGYHPDRADWAPDMVRRIADWAEDDHVDADIVFGDNPVDNVLARWHETGVREGGSGNVSPGFKDYVAHVVAYKRYRLTRWPDDGQVTDCRDSAGNFLRIGQQVHYERSGAPFTGEVAHSDGPSLVLVWTADPGVGWTPSGGDTAPPFVVAGRRGGSLWWGAPSNCTPLPESGIPVPVLRADISDAEVADLRARAELAESQARTLRSEVDHKSGQIDAILTRLLEEANDRGWCTEWEGFLRWVSRNTDVDTSSYQRDRTAVVEWSETYTVRITQRHEAERNDWVDSDGEVDADVVDRYINDAPDWERRIQLAVSDALSGEVEGVSVDFDQVVEDSQRAWLP